MLNVSPGDILLTSSVGGSTATWRDRMLSSIILRAQKLQDLTFSPTCSHAELITNPEGETFSARWRTRKRSNGLEDYIGSWIIIGRAVGHYAMTSEKFWNAWDSARMSDLDGDVYPIHRLLLQGLAAIALPRWITAIGMGSAAICSEVVARFYHSTGMPEFARGWRGWTPANIEQLVVQGDAFIPVFRGELTRTIMEESGMPLFDIQSG
jgi:hypothetical protein